jgi:LuxR family transcriptional regulator, maltose regulon positive regulatory protein
MSVKESLLATKLFVPKLRSNTIKRPVLLESISDRLDNECRLILISAPAGYGKTTLALELINSTKCEHSWISLDEGDNDHIKFISYLMEAFKKSGVDIGPDVEKIVSETHLSWPGIMTMLLNSLSTSTSDIILVLDDYHVIQSSVVHEITNFLIEHLPINTRIVITTREDPPLQLPRLRARAQLVEVRIEDLRFNAQQADEFFKTCMGINLKSETVGAFASKTEGWIVGLQLAALALKGYRKDANSFVKDFNGTHRYIIDYLVEEVLIRQRSEVRDFLSKTSFLERMNSKLCDYVTDTCDSKIMLEELETANVFLIPLDGNREWYRYHHLFADSIRTELSEDIERKLHKKASVWYANNGFKEEAVRHALKSSDYEETVRLIEGYVEELFKNAQLPTLLGWLDKLPDELVVESEILCMRKAWALFITGDIERAAAYVYSFDKEFLESASNHNKGLLMSLQALFSEYTGEGDAEQLASKALELLESWDPVARIATMNTLGKAQADNGRNLKADKTFIRAFEEGSKLGYTFITILALLHLGNNLNTIGKRKQAINLYNDYISGMVNTYGKSLPFSGPIYAALSGLYYEGNELEKAKEHALKGFELNKNLTLDWTLNSRAWLARILHALGERDKAIKTIEEALEISRGLNVPRVVLKSEETMIDLLIKEKELDRAGEFADSWETWINNIIPPLEQAALAYVRFNISKGNVDKALKTLKELEEPAIKGGRLRILISVYALYSKAYYKDGSKGKAANYIEQAIKLAEPEGYYRVLLDEGEIVYDLILKTRETSNFVSRMKMFFKEEVHIVGQASIDNRQIIQAQGLIEQLSQREIELLNLIAGGFTNNEIAKQLFITLNTTQWHISNIYSKLGVKNRTQAIAKAKELNLL